MIKKISCYLFWGDEERINVLICKLFLFYDNKEIARIGKRVSKEN